MNSKIISKDVALKMAKNYELPQKLLNNINDKIIRSYAHGKCDFSIQYADGLTQENYLSVSTQLQEAGYNVQMVYANGKIFELYAE
ncbi:hypothetical protein [Limosilactobacillus reuteri]|uniref:Uncharacterized protein n=1 Tax=Limosilactobacillus reuteri TaxID=1598 RepID=A0A1C1ZNG9_LIMRT|nr:hypothetical protein [Limosilactobacillus reuteri]OCW67290.1 hypothetical protein BBP13_09510 [Limosilactobacillus reuteri]OYS59519.1 hypothetical protein CBF88_05855 [Limosilactobacillus reuteri]OYS61692.1 hypothetical protein CBF91_04720 [Limosilactobacillus reuteri]OYS65025.1 hypothetical protein CBF89_04190 [Limosilactobacillus reuteri]OYS72372.1 hypothetical protein CBG01_05740 [Limosilactobacillus reuteri]